MFQRGISVVFFATIYWQSPNTNVFLANLLFLWHEMCNKDWQVLPRFHVYSIIALWPRFHINLQCFGFLATFILLWAPKRGNKEADYLIFIIVNLKGNISIELSSGPSLYRSENVFSNCIFSNGSCGYNFDNRPTTCACPFEGAFISRAVFNYLSDAILKLFWSLILCFDFISNKISALTRG